MTVPNKPVAPSSEPSIPADLKRCLCGVCIYRRKHPVELSKEEQFDFDAWHEEPMIGWQYRYLGYMAEVLKGRERLGRAEDRIAELESLAWESIRYTDCEGQCASDDTCPHNKLRAALAAPSGGNTKEKA